MRLSGPFAAAIEALFAPLAEAPAVLIAVSGGPDSVALLHLLAAWREEGGAGPALAAATVDHGLREQSAAEAAAVAARAGVLGIPHVVLPWTGAKPKTGVQAAARRARYRLLVAAARQAGCSHLVTAHTLDDQAETVLIRLAAGTGLTGLSGMRAAVDRDGIRHLRPLLGVRKAALVEACRQHGWPYVEDPSNADETSARVRWRRLVPALAAEGLTPERLARLAERAQQAEQALDFTADAAFAKALRSAEPQGVALSAAVIAAEPFEIALRVLARALRQAEAPVDPRRLKRLEAATRRLRDALEERRPVRATLQGRLLVLDRAGLLTIRAEPERRRGRSLPLFGDAVAAPHSLGKDVPRT